MHNEWSVSASCCRDWRYKCTYLYFVNHFSLEIRALVDNDVTNIDGDTEQLITCHDTILKALIDWLINMTARLSGFIDVGAPTTLATGRGQRYKSKLNILLHGYYNRSFKPTWLMYNRVVDNWRSSAPVDRMTWRILSYCQTPSCVDAWLERTLKHRYSFSCAFKPCTFATWGLA